MIVPQFWAEARVCVRAKRRQITVRRFGWSDVSLEDAQAMADARAREAFERVVVGEPLARRELKRAYNGSEGVPIREEIVARHGETVITRNVYGSLCLNTPNILFADMDLPEPPGDEFSICSFLLAVAGAVTALGVYLQHMPTIIIAGLAAVIAGWVTGVGCWWYLRGGMPGQERRMRRRIERFSESRPQWSVRLYRTPAGFRALVTHRLFDPADSEVGEFFAAVNADRVYVRMCRNQRCFRARVSPKPWRIGISEHFPKGWPAETAKSAERTSWVAAYAPVADGFASCVFLVTLGSFSMHPDAASVCSIHDDLCRANSSLPIA